MSRGCPSPTDLELLADGALPPEWVDALRPHIADCPDCRTVLDELELIDGALITALSDLPAVHPRPAGRALRFSAVAAAAAAGLLFSLQLVDLQPPGETIVPDMGRVQTVAQPSAVRVAVLEGDVEVRPSKAPAPHGLVENEPLREGDVIRVSEGSRAKLEIPEQVELYINERTQLALSGSRGGGVRLRRGELVARRRGGPAPLRIETPHGTIELESGETLVRADPRGVQVWMPRGRGTILRNRRPHPLDAGRILFLPADPAKPIRQSRPPKHFQPAWLKHLQPVVFLDTFRAPGLSEIWKAHPAGGKHWQITQEEGRRVLVLRPPARTKTKKPGQSFASLMNNRVFPIRGLISFQFAVRRPDPGIRGTTSIVLGDALHPRRGLQFRYILSAHHEALQVRRPGRRKADVLWRHKTPRRAPPQWLRVEIRLGPRSVTLIRNDRPEIENLPHGIRRLPPLRLHLVSVRPPSGEGTPFESRFGRVAVRRLEAGF